MIGMVEHLGFENCVRIENGDCEVIVSTAFGPRILHYSFDGGDNILGWHPSAEVRTDLGTWKPYGGHRLWLAPENMPLSYAPDNDPIEFQVERDLNASFLAPTEESSGIQKQFTVTLSETGTHVTIDHRITNRSDDTVEYSLWALTILAPGGEVVVPNEPHAPYGPENLLPVRTLTQWSYTDFADKRWGFSEEAIRLRVDETAHAPQKFGVMNKEGWAAYECKALRFTKRADYIDDSIYPDMNSNFEAYTAGSFVELETLSPLRRMSPGESASHRETWELRKA
jgi:hypothetical protein